MKDLTAETLAENTALQAAAEAAYAPQDRAARKVRVAARLKRRKQRRGR